MAIQSNISSTAHLDIRKYHLILSRDGAKIDQIFKALFVNIMSSDP